MGKNFYQFSYCYKLIIKYSFSDLNKSPKLEEHDDSYWNNGGPSGGGGDTKCCLVENGRRCGRTAGNASYSKRIQKTVAQKKLKLHMDNSVNIKI